MFFQTIGMLFRDGKLIETRSFLHAATAREEMEKLISRTTDTVVLFRGEIVQPLTKICMTCMGKGRRPLSELITESLCPGCNGVGREPEKSKH